MSIHIKISDVLELRQRQPEDAEEMFALTDANRAYLRQWLPWLDSCTAPDDTRKNIESSLRSAAEGTGLAVCIWFEGRIVGVTGFNEICKADRIGHVGYWLGSAHTGRGIMTASVRALVDYGFGTLGLNRITINVATGNARSRAVAERLGFWLEGIAREAEWLYDHFEDQAAYAMTQRCWQTLPSNRPPIAPQHVPRSAYDRTGGIVYFARMLNKIRLHAAGKLPADYHANLGVGFDGRCCRFLGVSYAALRERVLAGASDEEVLAWCFANGRQPGEEEVFIWNSFMMKRGWCDFDPGGTPELEHDKAASGFAHRNDIVTFFDFYEVDEGRKP